MKQLLILFFFSYMFCSCGDITQEVIIGADGNIDHSLTFVYKEASFMREIAKRGPFSIDTLEGFNLYESNNSLLFGILHPEYLPEKFDTTLSFYELGFTDFSYLSSDEIRLLQQVNVHSKVDKAIKFIETKITFRAHSSQEKEQIKSIIKKVARTNATPNPDVSNMAESDGGNELDFMINGVDYELYNDLGKVIMKGINLQNVFKEFGQDDMDGEQMEEMLQMAAMFFKGKPELRFVLPGRVISVEGISNYEIINENEVLISGNYIEVLRDSNYFDFVINYQPTQPITDPKVTEVWDPEPIQLSFTNHNVPSDAIVLFDGKSTDMWQHQDGRPVQWTVSHDILTVLPGSGDIKTKESFSDCQLHLEWMAPREDDKSGQGRGNSGIFFQEKYEVQILNSYDNRTYANGQAAAIYKQYPPLVNATKPPSEWNTYDIIFKAPKFDKNGKRTKEGTFTVIHNGVLVQNNVTIKGTTEYIGMPKVIPHGEAPLVLQDHSNRMSFRNIWVRRL